MRHLTPPPTPILVPCSKCGKSNPLTPPATQGSIQGSVPVQDGGVGACCYFCGTRMPLPASLTPSRFCARCGLSVASGQGFWLNVAGEMRLHCAGCWERGLDEEQREVVDPIPPHGG